VKPSPHPIRKTWDEQKMQELAQSIKEQGVIVPIKVRPNGAMANFIAEIPGWYELYGKETGVPFDFFEKRKIADLSDRERPGTKTWHMAGFEVVYGHRRVEAARRAGLEAIPAIIESVKDGSVIWEALIENLSNENMSAYEKGEEIERLKQAGFSIMEQSRRIGVHNVMLQKWRDYYMERASGIKIEMIISGNEMIEQVQQVKRALGDDLAAKQAVIDKASNETLDRFETRAVADAYVAAKTPELKQAILETSGKLGSAERITQVAEMKVAGRHVADGQEVRREKAFQEFDSAVKDFLDAMKMFEHMIDAATKAAKYGKFSPESKPFTIRKIDRLINALETLKEELSNGL
jgi:ParB-like chromosome segregation protein Spo0J